MAYSDYWITKVYFEQLKNLRNCTIEFNKNLVGILGVNGSGKSTILHALACMYKPIAKDKDAINYKFSMFFTPNTHCRWNNSRIKLFDTYKDNGEEKERKVEFEKLSRWTPRYDRRLERHVVYIGIQSCVPAIEKESKAANINLKTINQTDPDSLKIKKHASYVLNMDYKDYMLDKATHRDYIGVRKGGLTYCALSMGAGEQRVFLILEQLIKAPKGALILIDEIDLLLHKDALKRLLETVNKIAIHKKIQLIFTTHNHSILGLNYIQFIHLYQTDDQTCCFENSNPDFMYRLTGEQERPISIFVEDDLAQALTKQIVSELQIKKFVTISTFGAASNCFTCASAVRLMAPKINNILFVLDGDVFVTEEEKIKQLKKVCSGNEVDADKRVEDSLQLIAQFVIPKGYQPEKYYHHCILNVPDERLSEEEKEYKSIAQDIEVVDDAHRYLSDIIQRVGEDRVSGLKVISQILSKSDEWKVIVSIIKNKIEGIKKALNI